MKQIKSIVNRTNAERQTILITNRHFLKIFYVAFFWWVSTVAKYTISADRACTSYLKLHEFCHFPLMSIRGRPVCSRPVLQQPAVWYSCSKPTPETCKSQPRHRRPWQAPQLEGEFPGNTFFACSRDDVQAVHVRFPRESAVHRVFRQLVQCSARFGSRNAERGITHSLPLDFMPLVH